MQKTGLLVFSVMVAAISMSAITAHADGDAALASVRADIIASGTIPDTYLIEPTGTYWDANGGAALKQDVQDWINFKGTADPSDRFQNGVNRVMYNIEILLEAPANRMHEVTALLVAKERLAGTYGEDGYLKKYHDYVIGEYEQS